MAGTATFSVSSSAYYSTFRRRPWPTVPSLSFSRRPPKTPSRRPILPRIFALTSNDIKVGLSIEVEGAPWRILEFLHVKPGKGAAFVRTKMRNYITGNTVEKTFRAGSTGEYVHTESNVVTVHISKTGMCLRWLVFGKLTLREGNHEMLRPTFCYIEEADVLKETKQFTYKDGAQYVFMDLNTFEEIRLNEKDVGDKTKWLKEGMDCNLLFWNGKVIDFELPITVQLTVVDVDPGLKGDTAQGGSKPAVLDTGAVVNVPLFVNMGDEILVDTRTGQYMSRA